MATKDNTAHSKIIRLKSMILGMDANSETRRIYLKTYFTYWRQRLKVKQEQTESVKSKLEHHAKLDALMETLIKYKREKEGINEKIAMKVQQRKSADSFKCRFQAQKSTIEQLTLKLEEKNRLIDELKLGILNKDALRSINETKIEIRKIFANCSAKVRYKLAPPIDYSEKFMVSTQKAPKILQEMEQKALERAKKREIILERKRTIEENKKRTIAEALEKKRVQNEEEKKRNLEVIKERRRRELEMEKNRQVNKTIFFEKWGKAVSFHIKNVLKKVFKSLVYNYRVNQLNYKQSEIHYKVKITTRAFTRWRYFLEGLYRDKYDLADALFTHTTLSKTFNIWWEFRLNRMRSMQVAEDFYDLLIQNNTFVCWHRNVCIQLMQREKQMRIAEIHYNRRILFHYFYQWRSLPAVVQLEKAKEQKKKKWRARVWEVLPDYKPPKEF